MRLLAGFLLAAMIFAANTLPRVSRTHLSYMERRADQKVIAIDSQESGFLLGPTRGVYLQDYGAVFTTEVDLLPSAAPNPFRGEKPDVPKLRALKQKRIETLKLRMLEVLVESASPLDSVPLDKKVALAVTIPYYPFEDAKGLPAQILVEAPRRDLVKGDVAALLKTVRFQEF